MLLEGAQHHIDNLKIQHCGFYDVSDVSHILQNYPQHNAVALCCGYLLMYIYLILFGR